MNESIFTTLDLTLNAPRKPAKKVERANMLDVIDSSLDRAAVVFIQAEPQFGKSQLVADYVRRHESSAVAVFFQHDAPIYYSGAFLRLTIAEQIQYILSPDLTAEDTAIDEQSFIQYLLKFQRFCKRARSPITILIDGLADSSDVDLQATLDAFNSLPSLSSDFRLLVTGTNRLYDELGLAAKKAEKIPLFPLSPPESALLICDLGLSSIDLHSLLTFAAGNVAFLQTIRSMLLEGVSVDDLLSDKKGSFGALLDLEWNRIADNPQVPEILSLLVFSHSQLTTQDLANLTHIQASEVRAFLAGCRFVSNSGQDDVWAIVSVPQRTYLRSKLAEYRVRAEDVLISRLLSSEESSEQLIALTPQLVDAGRHTEVLSRLNSTHFSRLLTAEGSLRRLRSHASYGVIAAQKCDNEPRQLQFSIIESTVSGASLVGGTEAEIEALLAIGDDDQAVALAMSTTPAEDRIRQVASAIGCFARNRRPVPDQLTRTFHELWEQLSPEIPDSFVVSMAADILPADVDLALRMLDHVESTGRKHRDVGNSVDNRPAHSDAKDSPQRGETQKSDNGKHRPMLEAAALLLGKMTAADVQLRLEKVAPEHRLFIIQKWLDSHRSDPDSIPLAVEALDIVLRSGLSAPKTSDLREIAVVLPYIQDREHAEKLIGRFESQTAFMQAHGTSEDWVRLRLLVFRAKQNFDDGANDLDLIDLFALVHDIADVGARVSCYGWILYHLQLCAHKGEIETRTGIAEETTQKLLDSISDLLENTADHYLAAIDAVRSLCMFDPERALTLVLQFNTEERRQKGFILVARSLAENGKYNDFPAALTKAIDFIVGLDRDKVVAYVLRRIVNRIEARGVIPVEPRLLVLWKKTTEAAWRAESLILTHKIHHITVGVSNYAGLVEHALEAWSNVFEADIRVRLGHRIVKDLSNIDVEEARLWLARVRQFAESEVVISREGARNLYLTNDLLARLFSAHVVLREDAFDDSLSRAIELINRMQSVEDRAVTYALISVHLHFRQKRDWSRRIVTQCIDPLLAVDFEHNEHLGHSVLSHVAPALYLNQTAATLAHIRRLSTRKDQDDVLANICTVIFTKMLPSEFYQERERSEFYLEQVEVSDILSLIKEMRTDHHIFRTIKRLCNSLSARKNEHKLRRSFVVDILSELKASLQKLLPDQENIKHEGFLLASLAHVHKCQISEGRARDNNGWRDLLARARQIPNRADRAVVVSIIASCAGGMAPFATDDWFDDVHKDILAIPSDRDRIDRFKWVAEILEPLDKFRCRQLIKEAMSWTSHLSADGQGDMRRKIVDLAHNVDPAWVKELIDIMDDDEAGQESRRALADRKRVLDGKKDAASDIKSLTSQGFDGFELAEIAYENVCALNADRQLPKPLHDFLPLAVQARKYPFPMVFPIWSWIIENAIRKPPVVGGAKTLAQIFDAVCAASDVANVLATKGSASYRPRVTSSSDLVGPGEREVVYKRIKDWGALQFSETIYLSDPFFGPDDVDILKAIAEVYTGNIVVLTSKKQMLKQLKGQSHEDAFRDAWNEICESEPPPTEIAVLGVGQDGEHPIHDRWLVSPKGGLRLGTSANSLGMVRISEISEFSPSQSVEKVNKLCELLDRNTKTWKTSKLQRTVFSL